MRSLCFVTLAKYNLGKYIMKNQMIKPHGMYGECSVLEVIPVGNGPLLRFRRI